MGWNGAAISTFSTAREWTAVECPGLLAGGGRRPHSRRTPGIHTENNERCPRGHLERDRSIETAACHPPRPGRVPRQHERSVKKRNGCLIFAETA